jgi:hypothetical protein
MADGDGWERQARPLRGPSLFGCIDITASRRDTPFPALLRGTSRQQKGLFSFIFSKVALFGDLLKGFSFQTVARRPETRDMRPSIFAIKRCMHDPAGCFATGAGPVRKAGNSAGLLT